MMETCSVQYFCSWWGLDHLGLEPMLSKIAEGGYDGVEIGIPEDPFLQDDLRRYLEKYNLDIIAHQYQADHRDFESYVQSFRTWLEVAASFGPLLINSHTGRDFWSLEQNTQLVQVAREIEDRYRVSVIHETHRGRFLYSTAASRMYFEHLPDLRINADLSHWVCVSESLLQDQEPIVEEAISRAEHIHARVGYAEGPQVPDPFAMEWHEELEVFMGWWKRILMRFQKEGREFLTITPECGPPPYTWRIPGSREPLSDFWEVNLKMMEYLQGNLR